MPNILPLVTLPTPTLRERSVEVDPKEIGTPAMQVFLEDLIATMFVADGIGIAAPQVGRNERIIIVNERSGPKAYFNPEITKTWPDLIQDEEGCLSVPGVWGPVKRHKKVHFKALDRHARVIEFDARGLYATVYQHEIDHLNGVLFIDKVETVTRGQEKLNEFFPQGLPAPLSSILSRIPLSSILSHSGRGGSGFST